MDAINTLPIWVQVIIYITGTLLTGAGIGNIVLFIRAKYQNKKDYADAELTLGQGWRDLLIEIRAEMQSNKVELSETKTALDGVKKEQSRQGEVIEKQQKKIIRLGDRILYLTKGNQILTEQVIRLNQTPCWEPDDWELGDWGIAE